MTAQILIWNLYDSKTTLDELRENLPELSDADVWIVNEAQDRFGLIAFSGRLPDLGRVRELTGADPQVVEEFDVLT